MMRWAKFSASLCGAALALAIGWASESKAALLVDTLTNPAPVGANFRSLTPTTNAAEMFTNASQLGTINFFLNTTNLSATNSLIITLWTDALAGSGINGTGGVGPQTKIATLATLNLNSLKSVIGSGVTGLVELYGIGAAIPAATGLSAGENYWVQFAVAVNSGTTKIGTIPAPPPPATTAYAVNNLVAASGTWFDICISDDAACHGRATTGVGETQGLGLTVAMAIDAPEPASLAILGAALTGLGLLRRRQAGKSTTTA